MRSDCGVLGFRAVLGVAAWDKSRGDNGLGGRVGCCVAEDPVGAVRERSTIEVLLLDGPGGGRESLAVAGIPRLGDAVPLGAP